MIRARLMAESEPVPGPHLLPDAAGLIHETGPHGQIPGPHSQLTGPHGQLTGPHGQMPGHLYPGQPYEQLPGEILKVSTASFTRGYL
jgi:hypothetical protein